MCTLFRSSRFIDFDKGHVIVDPMTFARRTKGPWSLAQKIEVFECRVEVWQLGVAVQILKEMENPDRLRIWSHAAFGLVAVIFSYFEMIGKTVNQGSQRSNTASSDFNHGFCDVYPKWKPANGECSADNPPEVAVFRDGVRNGMYHLAGIKSNIVICRSQDDFHVDRTSGPEPLYVMDPHRVTRTIVNHFPDFVARLRLSMAKPGKMAEKFEEFFDTFYKPR